MPFTLEYAQSYNGKFHGWVVGGTFPTREDAAKCAASRGLIRLGDDHLISEAENEWE